MVDEYINAAETAEPKPKDPMQQINDAYKACGFGRFHVKLVFISFLGTVAGVLVTHTTSFLLPVAECDLKMGLLEKGLLNAAPFLGMTITSVIGGFLTDTFGRILFLKVGFGGMFFFSVVAGSSQTYEVLLTAKFFEGMLFATSISAHVTYLSEFCYKEVRDRVMICQASFVAMAQIISPAMAWGILTQDWNYKLFNDYIVLNTWNFYIYLMSLWALLACVLYSTLPESPKFLVGKEKYDEAREIIIRIYRENTRNAAESYPHKDIWKDITKEDLVTEKTNKKGIFNQITGGLRNAKPLIRNPMLRNLLILSCSNFVILAVYNVVRLWFPQLSAIVENYKIQENQDLCYLLDNYTRDLKIKALNQSTEADICIPKKSGSETYLNSIIVGLVCLLPYFVTGVIVNKVGKKAVFLTSGLISVGVLLGMRWSNSKIMVVALFSVITAISQSMKGLNQATAVEVFPTHVRSLGLSLMMLGGRFGTLGGNIGFPILLNMGCVVPFYTMSGMMLCVSVLTIFLPKKNT